MKAGFGHLHTISSHPAAVGDLPHVMPSRGARRDLSVLMQDHDGQVTIRFEYDAGFFEPATISAMTDGYLRTAGGFTSDTAQTDEAAVAAQ